MVSLRGLPWVVLLLGATTSALVAAVASEELPEDDEFRMDSLGPSEPSRTAADDTAAAAAAPAAAAWSDGKVSIAGFLSFEWAKHELHLGAVEYLAVATMVLYLVVYIRGRRRNYEIAQGFIIGVHGLFCSRFLDAGPALETPPVDRRQLLARDSCSTFLYYATGSSKCSGVLVTINLADRHDLFRLLWNMLIPVTDRVTVEVVLGDDDLEPLVFAVAPKRDVKKLQQSVPHLQEFASPTRADVLPPGLVCLSETFALVEPLLPPSAAKIISEYPDLLELVHFTDQNEQPIAGQAETPKKVLRFTFRLPAVTGNRTGDMRGGAKMIELALSYIEQLHKYKMPSSVKKKAQVRREAVVKRKSKATTSGQLNERHQQLKSEKLQREREEYETLTPEQKRRRDVKDEKKSKKAAANRTRKMKLNKGC